MPLWGSRAHGDTHTYMQSNQHRRLHGRGATEGQDEAHGAPDPEADEYERNQD